MGALSISVSDNFGWVFLNRFIRDSGHDNVSILASIPGLDLAAFVSVCFHFSCTVHDIFMVLGGISITSVHFVSGVSLLCCNGFIDPDSG